MDYDYVEDYDVDFGFMEDSIGKWIRIERGGPDKLEGKLLGIKSDHLIVQTAEGVVYVASQHIKTISEPIVEEANEQECDPNPVVVHADDLQCLLSKLQHKLVKINQNGPNALEGVLVMNRSDSVTIVHKMKDYVHYPLYHIKTVTWVLNAEKKGNDKKK